MNLKSYHLEFGGLKTIVILYFYNYKFASWPTWAVEPKLLNKNKIFKNAQNLYHTHIMAIFHSITHIIT